MHIKNSNIYPLPGNPHMLHLATIEKGLQEFVVMACIRGPKRGNVYIEELVFNTVDWSKDIFANCKFVDDDALAHDLARFVDEKHITDMKKVFDHINHIGKSEWLLG